MCHTVAPDAFFSLSREPDFNQCVVVVFFTRAHVWSPTHTLSGISVQLEVNVKMPNMKLVTLRRRHLIGRGDQAVNNNNNNNKTKRFSMRWRNKLCPSGEVTPPTVHLNLDRYIHIYIYENSSQY